MSRKEYTTIDISTKQEYDFAYMESWQVELIKIGVAAIASFFVGWGSHWLRSRARKEERTAELEDYHKKRGIEKVPEQEKLQEAEKLTSLFIEHRRQEISPEELYEFKEKILSLASQDELEARSPGKISDTKEEFLRRAYGYRHRAYILLLMTMCFQTAMRKHRVLEPSDFAEGNTIDEKIPNLIKRILDNGLEAVIPIRIIDEKSGNAMSVITPEIIEGLNQINSLIDLYKRIENNETKLPSRLDINNLFDKIGDALTTLAAGLEVVGTHSIIYEYRMTSAIESLKNELEQAETEQRPMRFPPSSSD